jgi:IS30 family transposase
VWGRLRRAGIRRARTPQTVTDEKVRVRYEAGLSIRAVAAELGMHQGTVWRHLEQTGVTEAKVRAGLAHHGIPIRRPGRRGAP